MTTLGGGGARSGALAHVADDRPIVIAHRGASGYLPEHTLAAKALAYGMGADYLEQDVVLTKDNHPIVLHDIHLDAVTDVGSRRALADVAVLVDLIRGQVAVGIQLGTFDGTGVDRRVEVRAVIARTCPTKPREIRRVRLGTGQHGRCVENVAVSIAVAVATAASHSSAWVPIGVNTNESAMVPANPKPTSASAPRFTMLWRSGSCLRK